MKKRSLLSLVLALVTLMSCLALPVQAEEMEGEETEETETLPIYAEDAPAPETNLAFGSVCVIEGCRTIDGIVPLAGSARRLDTAQGVFAFERNTGTVVYSYNPDAKLSPGGLTKIVTALVALEHSNLDDIVTVSSRNISRLPGGTQNQNLKNGEEMTMKDLLHCLIMQGANDAAIAIAEHVAGNQEAFVALMNSRIREMGCTATEFGNVHGLDGVSQYTTARDMARIVQEATRNETFRDIFKEIQYTVPETNKNPERKFQSQNYLADSRNVQKFFDTRVTGGMQSASSASGASVVFTAASGNLDYICVILGATRKLYDNGWQVEVYGNFEEAVELVNYLFKYYKSNRVIYYGQALKQFAVSNAECDVVVEPHIDINSVLPSEAHVRNLIWDYEDTGLQAPIKKGDLVATVKVWYQSCCIMEAELFAMEDVRLASSSGLKVLGGADRKESDSTFSRVVGIASLVILIPVVSYLGINAMLRSRRRAQRRRRRTGRRRS